jgi:tRNA-Thr(GGU) m(6)t(6)A37 methyltransferase TsaA
MRIIVILVTVVSSVAILMSSDRQSNKYKNGATFKEYPVNPATCDSASICFKPVGYFKTPFNQKTGAPRHGILQPETKGRIEILEKYRDALAMLDKFEYIIVLYYFNVTQTWAHHVGSIQAPQRFGVFATRTPKRPNPIGFSVVKVDSIRGCTLYVSGIDSFNDTPVLDIKPYLPSVDAVKSRKNRDAEYLFRTPYRKPVKGAGNYK